MKEICRQIVLYKYFNLIANILTVVTVLLFAVSTELKKLDSNMWYIYVEVGLFFFFLFEYIIRVVGSKNSLKKIIKPLMIIDLIVLLSFLLPAKLVELRFIRLLKLLSILKEKRYKYALYTMSRVCKDEKESLIVIGVFFFMLLLGSASFMCLLESSNKLCFSSILKSMYWSAITVTSVGYGDCVPATKIGKMIASFTALFGILLYSMLTALFATGFSKELKKIAKKNDKIKDFE